MSIKSRFEYDLDRILAGRRLDRISLQPGQDAYQEEYTCNSGYSVTLCFWKSQTSV